MDWGGGLWGGKTEDRERLGGGGGGFPECYGNPKINSVVLKESN